MSIITTLIWEAMLVAVWLWGLPALGIQLPLSFLITGMGVLAVYAVVSFRIGSRALGRKAVAGLSDMVGGRGRAVSPLTPDGTIRIEGELWAARSIEGNIGKGEEVEVVRQDGLKLFVRRSGAKTGEKPVTR